MTSISNTVTVNHVDLIDGEMLHIEEIARMCCVSNEWVYTRIEQEILHAVNRDGRYYCTSAMLFRAKQVANIEHQYDADPQLAALVVDLVEEVQALRNQIAHPKNATS